MRTMSPFLNIMQLFLMMTATVLGMLMLLLITPDIEDSMLRAVRRYNRRIHTDPVLLQAIQETVEGKAREEGGQGIPARVEYQFSTSQSGLRLDSLRRSFLPWPNSEQCSHFGVHFAQRKSLPMTALVSFPGSGNTWVRYLLETASGVFTGSVYTDRQILVKGFYGEVVPPDCGCTSVQKTHGFALAGMVPPNDQQKRAEVTIFKGKGILLLRNPYDALLSYRNFLYGGHTGHAPYPSFRGPEWETFASRLALVWRELAATWIINSREAMVLHYELLRLEPQPHLEEMLRFLRFPVDEKRLACVLSHIDGPFHRPRTQLFEKRDPFPEKVHRVLDTVISEVNVLLEQRGWKTMPTHLYKFYGRWATSNSTNSTSSHQLSPTSN